MLSKEAEKAFLEWETESSRITAAMFKNTIKKVHTNAIQCYTPINDKGEYLKEEYYMRHLM